MPEIVAHRGAKRERPENTLAAFARALELGADAFELDVHATRDGAVVVHHDPVVREHEGDAATLPIASMTRRQLTELDVGGEPIPLLRDVLELAAGRATVYVEIKGKSIEKLVVGVVRAWRATCAIHSFDHAAIARVRELAPEIPRGLLFEHRGHDMVAALVAHDARDLWPHVPLVTEELVAAVHAAGRRVVVWTVNAAADAKRLSEFGVDALCGDDVTLLREASGRSDGERARGGGR
ncbi:MAG TPA: glycerophosphodiester phosphodiesterase [Gemmatimonadaceae bacterium]|nr:glycerophosphodiester phosphodiesterase [Gemmatimonadaceae bacterium]